MHTHVNEFFFIVTLVSETDTRCNKKKPRMSEAMLETEIIVNTRTTDVYTCNALKYRGVILRFAAFQK